jgi:hypothetical protein
MEFMSSRFTIYRTICEQLDTLDRITDATECFHQMTNELGEGENVHVTEAEWIHGERLCIPRWYCHLCDIFLSGFRRHLSRKLEDLGDAAIVAQRHNEAISEYSLALSLDPTSPQGLIKRSKAYVAKGLWGNGLEDADKVRPSLSRRLVLVDGMIIR